MATQRPPGSTGAQRPPSARRRQQGAPGVPPQKPPGKESTVVRDLGPETVWHTRGLHGHTRLRSPLPPSRVPRRLLWGLLLVLLAVLANAVLNMSH
ncbi:hypothetical protein UB46_19450 [Burkholderiaceae bacterium 16]|nr:hypothetical protein UB46_19450 [Burkholderiaceae bacterium 16]